MEFTKTHDAADLGPSMEGQEVRVCGWVEDARALGSMTFLTVRDSTGTAQAVAKGNLSREAAAIPRQSSVAISGKIQKTRAKDLPCEVLASAIRVLGRASARLPIDPTGRVQSSLDSRLGARALDMRDPRSSSVFVLRHKILQHLRGELSKKFTEICTPKIIGSASEGGADLFGLEYFGRQAYLAQSPQLYKEQMTAGLERVFEIASFYRAENSHTGRHLAEFTSVDIEAAFMDYGDVMDVLESLVAGAFGFAASECADQLEMLGRKLEAPQVPFERITYGQAVEELRAAGQTISDGGDLADAHLRILGDSHPGFFFLTDWPITLKPFYIREKDGEPGLSRSFDLQFGYLELSSGGTRLNDPTVMRGRLAEKGLDPAAFESHLSAFEWGMPPHSGWGMGFERLIAAIAGLDNVREAVLYPRDPDRLSP